MHKLLIVLMVGGLISCAPKPQGDPKIDSIKGLAFVCEEYRIILRDIRLAFRAGLLSSNKLQSANAIRRTLSPICKGAFTFSKAEAFRKVSDGARALALMKGTK
jgi:hypothetical protein